MITTDGMTTGRTIFHVDMDAFYASIEQRDNPDYRDRPVIVGADPRHGSGRGVVAACSYEARHFGIHSAQPISQAFRCCPHGVYLRPSMEKYVTVSKEIRSIFLQFTPRVEPISIDEAFLDMSRQVASSKEAIDLARSVKTSINEKQKLSASIGIAPNKFVAKIASDLEKPEGLVQVSPHEIQDFLAPLPISRLWGVGPKTEQRLRRMSIDSIGDLRRFDRGFLQKNLGKLGDHLWSLARGIDNRQVKTSRVAKSVSRERTFGEDTRDPNQLIEVLRKLSSKVSTRLKHHDMSAKTVKLKLRYSDFTTLTRQKSFRESVNEFDEIYPAVRTLFIENWDRRRSIRLIGVGVSSLEKPSEIKQLRLF